MIRAAFVPGAVATAPRRRHIASNSLHAPLFRQSAVPPRVTVPRGCGRAVGAWVSGVATRDAAVIGAAGASGARVVVLMGKAGVVADGARAAGVETVYCDGGVWAAAVGVFEKRGLVLVAVGSGVLARGNVGVLAAAPLLMELRNDKVSKFYENGDGKALLDCEEDTDTRSPLEQIVGFLERVYLPVDYGNSVTKDYLSFTKYRTIQNLFSAIMAVVSTEALLFGLGLGKNVAAGAAAASWVLKDGFGYIAKVVFGSYAGHRFDRDPKSWRIAADMTEDLGGCIELLTPLFPGYFLLLASAANILRGVAAMTGTATRHVVYRSLAANGSQNVADIATKGESQGVTMKLLGLGSGILISSKIGQHYYALLGAYSLCAVVHLAANWRSMLCVQFNFFNKQRAALAIESSLRGERLPTPYDVSHSERIILPPWRGFQPNVRVGVSVRESGVKNRAELEEAKRMFKGERFLIFAGPTGRVSVLLKPSASGVDELRAFYTVQAYLQSKPKNTRVSQQAELKVAYNGMRKGLKSFVSEAQKAGWNTEHVLLTDEEIRVSW